MISDYEYPACKMVDIAAQLGDNVLGKCILLAHNVLHAIFKLFDTVIEG